jgi:HK97 family phage portal protein
MSRLADVWTVLKRGGVQPFTEERSTATTLTPWMAGKAIYPDREIATYDQLGYRQLGLIFAAVTMTAEAVASATLRVYDENNDNETVPNHPLRQLMRRPNPEMEESRFLSLVTAIATIANFCVVEKERSEAGRTVALWPLRSDWLRPILRDQAPPDWEYRIPGTVTPTILKAEDVLVFTYADRIDRSPFGIGPLEVCLREVGLLNRMTDFIKQFFDQGAIPFYGLIPDLAPGQRFNQQQVDFLQESWMRRHGGLDQATRPAVMSGIKDVKRLSLDMNELAYVDLRDLSDLAIAQAFRIPASMLQIRAGLEHSDSRANAEVDEAKFYRQTITPLWRRLDGVLSINLLPEFSTKPSESLEFDKSNIQAMQDDRNEKAGWLVDGGARGVFSIHTVHRELGIPVPDGDDFYLRGIATEGIAITEPIVPDLPALTGTPPKALPATTPRSNGRQRMMGDIRVGADDFDLSAVGPPPWPFRATYTPAVIDHLRSKVAPFEYRKASSAVSRKLIGRIADRQAPSIRAFFRAQGQRLVPAIANNIRAGSGAWETRDVAELVDWENEDDALRAVLTQLYLVSGKTAFDAVKDTFGLEIGIDFTLANPHVKDTVDKLGTRVVGINETTRQSIAEKVTAGLNDGKSVTDIAADLNGIFDDPARSMAIARTESMVSYGEANVLAFRQSGVTDRAQVFDNPEHTDDYGASDGLTCAERDGTVWPLDEAMDHIYADHVNGSAVLAPVNIGEAV